MTPDCKPIALTGKFSTRPADHNTTRVRNNQRRHRARVKSQIADLEARLSESERKLEAALATISRLTAENEAVRRQTDSYEQSGHSGGKGNDKAVSTSPLTGVQDSASTCTTRPQVPPRRTVLETTRPSDAQEPVSDVPLTRTSILTSTIISTSDDPHITLELTNAVSGSANLLLLQRPVSPSGGLAEISDENLPPPAPGECTKRCMDAYRIIEQQNFYGLDLATISAWLRPGFRRAIKEGDGCRVETNVLFALLDYISSNGV